MTGMPKLNLPTMREPLLKQTVAVNLINFRSHERAAENLEKRKRKFRIPKVQTALKLVDAVFVNQENLDPSCEISGC